MSTRGLQMVLFYRLSQHFLLFEYMNNSTKRQIHAISDCNLVVMYFIILDDLVFKKLLV